MKKEISEGVARELLDFGEKPFVPMTLVYLVRGDEVLLMKRKPNKEMVPGKRLGLGGKVEPGETILESARRELREEAGVEVDNLELRGTLIWLSDKNRVSQIFIYVGFVDEGVEVVGENREGQLVWHKWAEIGELEDLADHQRVFLPAIARGEDFYTGMAAYWEGELVVYCDNSGYFEERKRAKEV